MEFNEDNTPTSSPTSFSSPLLTISPSFFNTPPSTPPSTPPMTPPPYLTPSPPSTPPLIILDSPLPPLPKIFYQCFEEQPTYSPPSPLPPPIESDNHLMKTSEDLICCPIKIFDPTENGLVCTVREFEKSNNNLAEYLERVAHFFKEIHFAANNFVASLDAAPPRFWRKMPAHRRYYLEEVLKPQLHSFKGDFKRGLHHNRRAAYIKHEAAIRKQGYLEEAFLADIGGKCSLCLLNGDTPKDLTGLNMFRCINPDCPQVLCLHCIKRIRPDDDGVYNCPFCRNPFIVDENRYFASVVPQNYFLFPTSDSEDYDENADPFPPSDGESTNTDPDEAGEVEENF